MSYFNEQIKQDDQTAEWRQYISSDPDILYGKPVVTGTRLSVAFLLDLFAGGWTEDDVLEEYPQLTRAGLRAVFAYAADQVAAAVPQLVRT